MKINEESDNYLVEDRHKFEDSQLVEENNLIEYSLLVADMENSLVLDHLLFEEDNLIVGFYSF